jgi:HK97 gp10 family phage protein
MAGESQVTGFKELFAKMDALAEEIGKGKTDAIWRKAMKDAIDPVKEEAKSRASEHSDTGQMMAHIYSKAHKPTSRDKASSSYMGEMMMARVTVSAIRDDTKYRFVLNKRGKVNKVYYDKRPVPVSQEFGNARTPAHPFMRVSLTDNLDKVQSRLATYVWAAIEKFAAGK